MPLLSTDIISDNQLVQEEHRLKDIAAERALLCCIMQKPAYIFDAARLVSRDAFFFDLNRYIFDLMLWVSKQAESGGWEPAFDCASMLSAAKFAGKHAEESFRARTDGMEQYRSIEAMRNVVNAAQFYQYVQLVNDCAHRVAIYRKAREAMVACMDRHRWPLAEQVAGEYGSDITSIAVQLNGQADEQSKIQHITVAEAEYFGRIKTNFDFPGAGLFAVPVHKFPFLMQLMNGGYHRKGVWIVVARPKVGKSTFLWDNAIASAQQGQPTLMMDNEMSREEFYGRGLSRISGVHEHAIMNGITYRKDIPEHLRDALEQAVRDCRKLKLYYVNVAGKHPNFIASIMREFRNKFVGTREVMGRNGERRIVSNPALIAFDWMKLPESGADGQKEWQALGYLCSKIKDTAALLDIAVIAGAQNNREALNMTPQDYEFNPEKAVAGSDRLAQFCTGMATLRNLTPTEIEALNAKYPPRTNWKGEALTGAAAAQYNQMLHFSLQRRGEAFPKGIPLYLDRGKSRYEEMAVARDAEGNFLFRAGKYGPECVPSAYLTEIIERRRHEPKKKEDKGGDNGMPPSVQAAAAAVAAQQGKGSGRSQSEKTT